MLSPCIYNFFVVLLFGIKNLLTAPVAQPDRVFGYEPKGRGFESLLARHVVADYVSFATTFLLKSHRLTHAVSPPFRKKSRLLRLFACKRAHNASAALPTFCGFESSTLAAKMPKISFLCGLNISERVTLVPIFCVIKNQPPAPLFFLFRKKLIASRSAQSAFTSEQRRRSGTFCGFESI